MTYLELKTAIRERDGNQCLDCGMSNGEHKARCGGQSLHVHRVVSGSEYSLEPGVCRTLCVPCHSKADIGNESVRPFATILAVNMQDELKDLLADAADKDELPMNEWIVRLLAKHFRRPELATIPRKRMGRPRKETADA